tara:strand:- start:966 stop:1130 length:165 start_codon:yes stop_codon:yes gene_type:complete
MSIDYPDVAVGWAMTMGYLLGLQPSAEWWTVALMWAGYLVAQAAVSALLSLWSR